MADSYQYKGETINRLLSTKIATPSSQTLLHNITESLSLMQLTDYLRDVRTLSAFHFQVNNDDSRVTNPKFQGTC